MVAGRDRRSGLGRGADRFGRPRGRRGRAGGLFRQRRASRDRLVIGAWRRGRDDELLRLPPGLGRRGGGGWAGGAARDAALVFALAGAPPPPAPAARGREGAERPTEMIGSSKPASRSCPVVLDPTAAARLLVLLGQAIAARS